MTFTREAGRPHFMAAKVDRLTWLASAHWAERTASGSSMGAFSSIGSGPRPALPSQPDGPASRRRAVMMLQPRWLVLNVRMRAPDEGDWGSPASSDEARTGFVKSRLTLR